ncbi:MAG: membrane protein insertion efficiency factor YidD [Ignavibacteriales bacterium]|nr:membrane protein insertion efficiency factor YidD [Ignavibacteriales bacterium]
MKLLCVLCVLCGLFNSQSFTQSWEPKPIDYTEEIQAKSKYYKIEGDIPEAAFKLLVNGYRLFISEPDGENCPFNPSCSRFFVEALGQTNIIEAFLLTSDRLIRDTSFGNKFKHYHIDKYGYLVDPPSRYISGN